MMHDQKPATGAQLLSCSDADQAGTHPGRRGRNAGRRHSLGVAQGRSLGEIYRGLNASLGHVAEKFVGGAGSLRGRFFRQQILDLGFAIIFVVLLSFTNRHATAPLDATHLAYLHSVPGLLILHELMVPCIFIVSLVGALQTLRTQAYLNAGYTRVHIWRALRGAGLRSISLVFLVLAFLTNLVLFIHGLRTDTLAISGTIKTSELTTLGYADLDGSAPPWEPGASLPYSGNYWHILLGYFLIGIAAYALAIALASIFTRWRVRTVVLHTAMFGAIVMVIAVIYSALSRPINWVLGWGLDTLDRFLIQPIAGLLTGPVQSFGAWAQPGLEAFQNWVRGLEDTFFNSWFPDGQTQTFEFLFLVLILGGICLVISRMLSRRNLLRTNLKRR